MQCKATTRIGDRCRRQANKGKLVCFMHGGNAGGDGRPIVHALYSRHLKGAELEAYEYHKSNPDMLSLTPEIALARTNAGRFMDSIPEGAPITAEMRQHIQSHMDLISKLIERDAKRLYNDAVVRELIAKQAEDEARILGEVVAQYVDADTAKRIVADFVAGICKASKISISVPVG